MEDKNNQIGLRNELYRKAIHLCSVVIPISYYYLDKNLILIVTGIATVLMIGMELLRKVSPGFDRFYLSVLGKALRKNELDVKKHIFTGGTYYIMGIFLAVLLFKREIASPAIMIMILSDTGAALVGKRFGKINFWNKTLEGSITFFVIGLGIVFLTPKITSSHYEYLIAVASLLLTTFWEALPTNIDDNLSIPVVFGIIYTILFYFI